MDSITTPFQRQLYRLPWSTTDNPIGWVEITDICNIHCDGCYRLVLGEGHKPLQKVKDEIDFLIKWRNCDGISLAGGEPILHPHITDIIQHISGRGVKSLILSNGYALSEDLLRKLKKAGLTGISFHIDSTQTRPEFKKQKIAKESDMDALRLECAQRLKKVGGIYSHFGITVNRDNLHEVPDFIQWGVDNMDVVNGISLITHRGLPVMDGVDYRAGGRRIDMQENTLGYTITPDKMNVASVSSKEVYAVIKARFPGYDAAAYLNGTMDHSSMKWLIGNLITDNKGKVFGAYGSKTMELAQTFHHLWFGKYLVYPKVKMGRRIFFMGLFDGKVRSAFKRYLGHCLGNPLRFFHPVKAIGIGVIQAPDVLPDGRIDMCDSCPDMCIHEGKLVNSCRLDECRKFGMLLNASVDSEQAREALERQRPGVTEQALEQH